jgi:hypothetical protein
VVERPTLTGSEPLALPHHQSPHGLHSRDRPPLLRPMIQARFAVCVVQEVKAISARRTKTDTNSATVTGMSTRFAVVMGCLRSAV